ncbi:MAG TPA: pseudouridine synthase [Polyangiaceae bacterium]|jgi:23S rRNA pseudouridine2605 synthase
MSTERLQKILARGGFSSRRAAEQLITEGRVRVNGRVVTELGSKADPQTDKVEVNGVRVVAEKAVYVLIHKPRGVVTTMSDPEGRPTIRELLAPIGTRVYPVGRLDFATSGVLLATNDGAFAEGLMHPKKAVPKTYVVKVHGVMEAADLDRWRAGIRLEDGLTLPAKASLLRHEGDKTWLELTIREGRNQQIRRMGEATGFPVMRLARVAFAGISAEGMKPGAWRYLTPDELIALKKEYGVPKRIVDAEMRPTGRTRPSKKGLDSSFKAGGRDRKERGERSGSGDRPERGRSTRGDRPQRGGVEIERGGRRAGRIDARERRGGREEELGALSHEERPRSAPERGAGRGDRGRDGGRPARAPGPRPERAGPGGRGPGGRGPSGRGPGRGDGPRPERAGFGGRRPGRAEGPRPEGGTGRGGPPRRAEKGAPPADSRRRDAGPRGGRRGPPRG